jgi:hypothetical protein
MAMLRVPLMVRFVTMIGLVSFRSRGAVVLRGHRVCSTMVADQYLAKSLVMPLASKTSTS